MSLGVIKSKQVFLYTFLALTSLACDLEVFA